jgi:Fe-S-cluster containining protein
MRIAQATGKKPGSFVSVVPEPLEREREEPAILVHGEPSLLVLKRQAGNVCIFYNGEGCGVYGFRPMLCRTYPFRLEGSSLIDMRSRACPERWQPSAKEKKRYAEDCRRYESEVRAYKETAQRWNQKGGGLESFLAFALASASHDPEFRIAKAIETHK